LPPALVVQVALGAVKHILPPRYARMVEWIVALQRRMDGTPYGTLELHWSGDSVSAKITESYTKQWFEQQQREAS
jgi:hypothetical protein